MSGDGPEEISALIGGVHERFPGHRFALLGEPDGYGAHVRLRWRLGLEGGDAVIEGTDIARIDRDRVASLVGFFDKVPS